MIVGRDIYMFTAPEIIYILSLTAPTSKIPTYDINNDCLCTLRMRIANVIERVFEHVLIYAYLDT